jgi:succinate dehydrogenase flavin-adding protein (antitoxin of CptAB toxin-antitoxin module)
MAIQYLDKDELDKLSDSDLDEYAQLMVLAQMDILGLVDTWTEHYNMVSDQYESRKVAQNMLVTTDSDTVH